MYVWYGAVHGMDNDAQRCPIVFSQERRTSKSCHTALTLSRADLTTQTAHDRRAKPGRSARAV